MQRKKMIIHAWSRSDRKDYRRQSLPFSLCLPDHPFQCCSDREFFPGSEPSNEFSKSFLSEGLPLPFRFLEDPLLPACKIYLYPLVSVYCQECDPQNRRNVIDGKSQISSTKIQINHKSQIQKSKTNSKFKFLTPANG